MSDKKNSLETYIVEQLNKLGISARRTRGSGSHTELGDIYNDEFYVECKIKRNHENIIMDRKKDFMKLIEKIPTETQKEVFIVIENKYGEKFIVIESEVFFRILNKWREND